MSDNILSGLGGLPKLVLTAPDGSRAEIYLHGAHVTSWVPAGGEDRIFTSAASEFKEGAAIRGGVPVIFPQFSGLGPLPKHGLVRTTAWELTRVEHEASVARAVFQLRDNQATRDIWPFAFQTELTVTLGGPRLEISLGAKNTGSAAFDFTAALHTYFRVANVSQIAIDGLGGLRFRDAVDQNIHKNQPAGALKIEGEVDRVYYNVPGPVVLREPHRSLSVTAENFPDVVVWNPGEQRCATLPDMEPAGYKQMVCIEAAVTGSPVHLQPGASWRASQTLKA